MAVQLAGGPVGTPGTSMVLNSNSYRYDDGVGEGFEPYYFESTAGRIQVQAPATKTGLTP